MLFAFKQRGNTLKILRTLTFYKIARRSFFGENDGFFFFLQKCNGLSGGHIRTSNSTVENRGKVGHQLCD